MTDALLTKLYVLHVRPFRDSSVIVDCLSEKDGFVSLMAKGAKRPKSPIKPVLSMFSPLLVSSYGRGELKSIKTAEFQQMPNLLQGSLLFSGFYVNELLCRLLHKGEACPEIFSLYEKVLASEFNEVALRCFELRFLEALGYGLCLTETSAGETLIAGQQYYFDPQVGFAPLEQFKVELSASQVFFAEHLQAIAELDFRDEQVRKAAKRLSRFAFLPLLGNRPLKARELFV